MLLTTLLFLVNCLFVAAQLTSASLKSFEDTLDLGFDFDPVKGAYWTNLPHHRRTPFAVSPDKSVGFLAYLDASGTGVHVIQVDTTTFKAVGAPVTIADAKEAGGLVVHNDGFALLTNIPITGAADAPPKNTPVPVLIRYTNGKEAWRTWLGGPGVHASAGLSMSPDLNGDLVYSYTSKLYGAYFVVTDYAGWAAGHFGDSIQYVNDAGKLQDIPEASAWGCSHNTGIAFEPAAQPPFASICAEDHGAIWLNTRTRGMDGVKIANENVINGASGEPVGGMGGSYSSLAKFPHSTRYLFAWATRGCTDLVEDSWRGKGYTQCTNRTANHNVGIAVLADKFTLVGEQASSTVGAKDGDAQLRTLTAGNTVDHSNVHVATFNSEQALVTWEEIAAPSCQMQAMGCAGAFSGTGFQLVDKDGKKIGDAVKSNDVYVAGDMVRFCNRICWPYVKMTWDLSKPVGGGLPATKTKSMSFACIEL